MTGSGDMKAGIDEAGVGPWAGPLVIAGVGVRLLGYEPEWWSSMNDSKKLSPRTRAWLYSEIINDPNIDALVEWVTNKDIDRLGLGKAYDSGVRRLVLRLHERGYAEVVIDGNRSCGVAHPIVHGDGIVPEIMAASIVAKHLRDAAMISYSETYRGYGFEANKGYGTAAHQRALELHGPSELHRQSVRPVQERLRAQANPDFVKRVGSDPSRVRRS